jgi:hypothetical protein
MRLSVAQRSSVILMDVLGYSLDEIGNVMGISVPAVKAALNRGRRRLRELAKEPEDLSIPVLAEPERSLLAEYVDRFNARDFDAIRDMLANEVRLELVNKTRMNGARLGSTFTTTPPSTIGILYRGWLTDARRSSCAILAIHRERRRISFCYSGRGTSSRTSEIFAMPATRLKARRSSYRVERRSSYRVERSVTRG